MKKMSKKIYVICALALLALFSISGCVQQPGGGPATTCGDGVCGSGETIADCPADCSQPPMPEGTGETGDNSPPELPF